MYLIVGLGNPGSKYENTRHNAGFMFIDALSKELNCKADRLKFKALTAEVKIGGKKCLLMKPQTYMNNSGESVYEAASFYKILPENILVVFDDISLDEGALRIKRKGSSGGHNGIKSIIEYLDSEDFPRMKIGIGAKPHPDFELADYVLSKLDKTAINNVSKAIDNAVKATILIIDDNIEEAMNLYSS